MVGGKVDQILDLLQSALDLEGELEICLKSCIEYGAFTVQGSSANTIVPQVINNCFNKKNIKYKALIILKAFIPYCSVETYTDHAISWMSQCLTTTNRSDLPFTILSLEVFAKLLVLSDKFTEVSKETGKQIVPKFLANFVKLQDNPQITDSILTCLEICMKLYSGPCGTQRGNILRLLINSLESGPKIAQLAASCFHLLPALGGGGKQGITYKTSWTLQYDSLLFSLHETLDHLFENVTEIQGHRKHEEEEVQNLKIIFPPFINKNPLSNAQHLVTRFKGLAECLTAMHLKSLCVAKQINGVSSVMGLVCRGLAVTSVTLSNKVTMEALALISVLPTVHIALLDILESFIVCFGRGILSQGDLICKLLNQIIKLTSAKSWPYAMNKPYRSLRLAAYGCLCTWLAIAKTNSCIHIFADELVPEILSDIYCKKPAVTLTMSQKTMKIGKKQFKKQLSALSQTNEDRTEKLGDVFANRSICIKALSTLELVINSTTTLLKPEIFKMMEITVLQILKEMEGGSLDIPVPYSDAECRDELYKLLLAICLVHGIPKYALTSFTTGLNDVSPQVRSHCQFALLSLEKIFHPSAPSLKFPKERENTVVSMTEKDILNPNTTLTALSEKGVLVIQIISNNANNIEKKKNTNQKVIERVVEKNINCLEPKKESKHTSGMYTDMCDDFPYNENIEVIELIDSEESEEFQNSQEDIYHFSDKDSVDFHFSEDEHNFSTCHEEIVTEGNNENILLNVENCLQVEEQETQLEFNCSDRLNSILEKENHVNSDVIVLKRGNIGGDGLSDGLNDDGLGEDSQPVVKKQKLEEVNNVNGIKTEDEEAMMLKDFVDIIC